ASSTSYYRITHTNAVNGGMLLFDDFRYFCWVARLGSNQDTSVVRLGLADSTANDSFVRGVFFQFYPDVDPDNWCAVCVSEGTATTVDTGVGVANTDWHRFEAFYDG